MSTEIPILVEWSCQLLVSGYFLHGPASSIISTTQPMVVHHASCSVHDDSPLFSNAAPWFSDVLQS